MTEKTIQSYEAMAKLCFNDETRQWAVDSINSLEKSFENLREIDTENVAPLVSVLDMSNVFREDIAKKFITRDELLSNAPEEYDGYFEVPRTLE